MRFSVQLPSALTRIREEHLAGQVVFLGHISSVRRELAAAGSAQSFANLNRVSVDAVSGMRETDPIRRARGALRLAARPSTELRTLARRDAQ